METFYLKPYSAKKKSYFKVSLTKKKQILVKENLLYPTILWPTFSSLTVLRVCQMPGPLQCTAVPSACT